jgi:hypothetical protein
MLGLGARFWHCAKQNDNNSSLHGGLVLIFITNRTIEPGSGIQHGNSKRDTRALPRLGAGERLRGSRFRFSEDWRESDKRRLSLTIGVCWRTHSGGRI